MSVPAEHFLFKINGLARTKNPVNSMTYIWAILTGGARGVKGIPRFSEILWVSSWQADRSRLRSHKKYEITWIPTRFLR